MLDWIYSNVGWMAVTSIIEIVSDFVACWCTTRW